MRQPWTIGSHNVQTLRTKRSGMSPARQRPQGDRSPRDNSPRQATRGIDESGNDVHLTTHVGGTATDPSRTNPTEHDHTLSDISTAEEAAWREVVVDDGWCPTCAQRGWSLGSWQASKLACSVELGNRCLCHASGASQGMNATSRCRTFPSICMTASLLKRHTYLPNLFVVGARPLALGKSSPKDIAGQSARRHGF